LNFQLSNRGIPQQVTVLSTVALSRSHSKQLRPQLQHVGTILPMNTIVEIE